MICFVFSSQHIDYCILAGYSIFNIRLAKHSASAIADNHPFKSKTIKLQKWILTIKTNHFKKLYYSLIYSYAAVLSINLFDPGLP